MSKKVMYLIFFLAVFFITAFSACKKAENTAPILTESTESFSGYSQTETSVMEFTTEISTENAIIYTETQSVYQNNITQTEQAREINESQNAVRTTEIYTTEHLTQKLSSEEQESTSSKYTRTGESVFTDKKDNKYIVAVAEKYKLDTNRLAAIYTIPDANGNIVLEFDGSKDENGKLIRNKDTLIAIYSIDKELNSKRASENSSLNEYSEIEMKTMFFTVNKYLIPKFENELNG